MTHRHDAKRWRPLLIGICCILILSALMAYKEKIHYEWGIQTFVEVWLLTASGAFAGIATITSTGRPVSEVVLIGIVNLLAVLSYSVRPSATTKVITVIGLVVWQFLGLALTRMGV